MGENETWFGSSNEETFHSGPYDSKEEAIKRTPGDEGLEPGDTFFVGRGILAKVIIRGHDVLDEVSDSIGEQCGEVADGYLAQVTSQEVERLEEFLEAAFNEWAKETDNVPEFYAIEDSESHVVPA